MLNAALSLEQAPPIHIPFRLFLTAPLFLVAAALVLGWQGEAVLASRWTPAALAVTHLITIGFLGQIMCGALLQMLPVLAGAPVPGVELLGTAVNLLLSVGAVLLGWGFLGGGPSALTVGAVSAFLGFLVFVIGCGIALRRARGAAQTVRAMRFAFGALFVTVILGLLLMVGLNGWIQIRKFGAWVDVHLAWGLMGWVGMLVAGVAFHVVPMFHVTPPYPSWLMRGLAPVAAAGLTLGSLFPLTGAVSVTALGNGIAVGVLVLFAAATVWLQLRRQRKRIDATLLFWWSSMTSVLVAALGWVLGGPAVLIGSVLLVGAGIGVSIGMLLKIVPFLSWFHLQHRQIASGRRDVRVPHVGVFLAERSARLLFACHFLGLTTLLAAWFEPGLVPIASGFLALSAVGLGFLVAASFARFMRVASALGGSVDEDPIPPTSGTV